MDKEQEAITTVLSRLDDHTFSVYAGVYSAKMQAGTVSAKDEIGLLEEIIRVEYLKTGKPILLYCESLLDQLLS